MIPLQLSLSGFLSYRDKVELDFSGFKLACISGANGAGKSSLLDAITWALFGQARKRDDSLINTSSETAEVVFSFAYEGNTYQVQRASPRGKTSMLEFNILQRSDPTAASSPQTVRSDLWKPLTERTIRDTQEAIERTLKMDYETFINASFFLQGKADQFTQQRPADRKRILGSILGLEIWETYRSRAAERRKAIETEISTLDGRLSEIKAELAEESARKERLAELQAELKRLSSARATQESALEHARQISATLAEQRKLVDALHRQLEATARQLSEAESRLLARQNEKDTHLEIIQRADDIQAAYRLWQQARGDVEYWDEIATRFRAQEKRRQEPLDEINAARTALRTEQIGLLAQQEAVESQRAAQVEFQQKLAELELEISVSEAKLASINALDAQLQQVRQRQADARAENPRLKDEMEDLKQRIDQLQLLEGALCPLCGQPLSASDRHRLVEDLSTQGGEMGDRYRANQTLLREVDQELQDLETQITKLSAFEAELRTQTQSQAQINARLEQILDLIKTWETVGAPRLSALTDQLEQDDFAHPARARLSEIDAELMAIGYDATAHDRARLAETTGRSSETDLRALERAQAALAPLDREIADLGKRIETLQNELALQQKVFDDAAAGLAANEAQAPDLQVAERELLASQELENRLRLEVGAALQKVLVLKDLKARQKTYEGHRHSLAQTVSQYRQLERAFGKDGVPALLIEQALPQIESTANEILDRLSAGYMSIRFVTQAAYKDKRREDLKETLDIQISDGAGSRDYEMFSGGEAFRVNFAIRLALSEVLAQRAGARLQTLVIDEGFGSQDAQGRQRLIEAINMVRQDFAKILVITHIEELKDAFPTRIEVEKNERGSYLRVM